MTSINTTSTTSTTSIINKLTNEIVDTIIDKWTTITDRYTRLVMKRVDWCSVCDKIYEGENIKTLTVDSSRSRMLYGWLLCRRCCVYEDLIKQYYYKHYCTFIPYSVCKHYKNYTFNFYRKSSNPSIVPYIQTQAYYKHNDYDFLTIDTKTSHVYAQISWKYTNNLDWTKLINLSNLIFYNRNIFGYSIRDLNMSHLSKRFSKGIIRQYNQSNEWYVLCCILYRNRIIQYIPYLIRQNIFKYWNCVGIFTVEL